MNAQPLLYPPTPVNVPLSVTAPSASFKKEVSKVLTSIILFFIVYFILVLFSIALGIGCIYAGFFVIVNSGHIIGIVAGAGIMSIGLMVFVFLIKFIFSVKKHDESGMVEVNKNDQPVLFDFIKQLTVDTQTQFPKKIVLSPDVNASVFYNDSFWSMLFPVRKNLQVGLGLVNSLTLSEFKAVMAHEFGHFSQRSMKLGSFVYNVNKAIYNMLYENKDYGDFLQKWGNLHIAIWIFVWITVQIVKVMQKILQLMYGFINKNYMGLSRQMEFHADAVAASVSGSDNCISALRKLEVSEVCYQSTIQKANELLQENTKLQNIYDSHNQVMEEYAVHNSLPLENHTPLTDETFFKKFKYHKINIKDQWASHPPRQERNAHLQELAVDAVKDSRPAWGLFTNAPALQEELTATLYKNVPGEKQQQHMDAAAFRERYVEDLNSIVLPKEYNGMFDVRQMNEMDLNSVYNKEIALAIDTTGFGSLFKDEWVAITQSLAGNEHDAAVLKLMIESKNEIKSFDYDGTKMKKEEAPALLQQLNTAIAQKKEQLQQHDETIVHFFYKAAVLNGEEAVAKYKEKYEKYFDNRKSFTTFLNAGQKVADLLAPLFAGQEIRIEAAELLAEDLVEETAILKPLVKSCIQMGIYNNNAELLEKAEKLVSLDYRYFSRPTFLDNQVSTLHQVIMGTLPLLETFLQKNFKLILEYQLALFKNLKAGVN